MHSSPLVGIFKIIIKFLSFALCGCEG